MLDKLEYVIKNIKHYSLQVKWYNPWWGKKEKEQFIDNRLWGQTLSPLGSEHLQ